MKKAFLLSIFIFVGLAGFALAEISQLTSGSSSAAIGKIFHINDTFKVGWAEGGDNYEASYKVWKIEETSDRNITILTHTSTGSIAMHSFNLALAGLCSKMRDRGELTII